MVVDLNEMSEWGVYAEDVWYVQIFLIRGRAA